MGEIDPGSVGVSNRVTGLAEFGLTESSLRRMGTREVRAFVHLRTHEVTPAVQKLPFEQRFKYMLRRVEGWVDGLRRQHPRLSLMKTDAKLYGTGTRKWRQLPTTLLFRGSAQELCAIASSMPVSSVRVAKVTGYSRRRPKRRTLAWYCVRALVVILVEQATAGLQSIEDRFMLVRAESFEDAKRRLNRQWKEYATPYLNSEGRMVTWKLDKVIDVYETVPAELDPMGTEVYSKLGKRRMDYVWNPKLKSRRKTVG